MPPNLPRLELLTISAFCRSTSIGRTKLYEEIKAGRLRTVKIGRARRIPYSEAQRWLDSLVAHSSMGGG